MTSALLIGLVLGVQGSGVAPLANGDFRSGVSGWALTGEGSVVEGREGGQALRMVSRASSSQPWTVEAKTDLQIAVRSGEEYRIVFWGRKVDGGTGRVTAQWQLGRSPWTAFGTSELEFGPEWRRFRVAGRSTMDLAQGESQVAFHFGANPGEFVIADVRFEQPTSVVASRGAPVKLLDLPGGIGLVSGGGGGEVQVEQVPVSGQVFSRASRLRFEVGEEAQPWSLNVRSDAVGAVSMGQLVVGRIWLRSRTGSRVTVIFEEPNPPHSKSVAESLGLGPEWRQVTVAGRSLGEYGPGEARFVLFLGFGRGAGEVEVGPVQFFNYGNTAMSELGIEMKPYGDQVVDDSWRAEAEQRIMDIRRGPVRVRVVDSAGRPVSGARVEWEQVRHGFRFGTAGPAALVVGSGAEAERYRTVLREFFNTFTFENDLKWPQETDEGLAQAERAWAWLNDHGFEVKGHNLVWGAGRWLPEGIMAMEQGAARTIVEERVRRAVRRWKGRLYSWDVVNEAVTERELWDRLGWDLFDRAFELTKEEDPSAIRVYNEFHWTEESEVGSRHKERGLALVKERLAAGASIQMIGIQGHVMRPATPMPRVLAILDEMYRELGLPMEITEYDFSSSDDAGHAQHMRDFLTAVFSHPQVESLILWGFWEGSHWRPEAAMFRLDWSERPAVRVYRDLVKGAWWTRASGSTGSGGMWSGRAFYGTHSVRVTSADGRSATVELETRRGEAGEVVVRL